MERDGAADRGRERVTDRAEEKWRERVPMSQTSKQGERIHICTCYCAGLGSQRGAGLI